MKIHVLTLFPEMFTPVTEASILGKAGEKGILDINLINIRDYSNDKHSKADDTPFGGGVGMVMLADPIFGALRSIGPEEEVKKKKILYMSPRGRHLNQQMIEDMAQEEEMVILCGHYEGVDQRVLDYWDMEEVSIGDYILTGGELPAMVLIDAVSRFIPGVLGTKESATDESIYSGLLECDQYTKPREYAEMMVPEVLFGGNHRLIYLWQLENALRRTRDCRPDLLEKWLAEDRELKKDEKKILDKILSGE
jgi:tRNA (guanine37-N1)-methyltransferase